MPNCTDKLEWFQHSKQDTDEERRWKTKDRLRERVEREGEKKKNRDSESHQRPTKIAEGLLCLLEGRQGGGMRKERQGEREEGEGLNEVNGHCRLHMIFQKEKQNRSFCPRFNRAYSGPLVSTTAFQ